MYTCIIYTLLAYRNIRQPFSMSKKFRFFSIIIGLCLLITPCFAHLSPEERFERVKGYLTENPHFTSHTQSKAVVEDFYRPDLEYVRGQYSKAQNRDELLEALDAFDMRVKRYMFEQNHAGTLSFTEYNAIAYTWTHILSPYVNQEDPDRPSLKGQIVDFWNRYIEDVNKPYHVEYVDFADTDTVTIPGVSETGYVPVVCFNRGWGFDLPRGRTAAVLWLGVPTNPHADFDYLRKERSDMAWYHDYEHASRSNLFWKGFMQGNTPFFAALNRRIMQTEDSQDRGCLELSMFKVCHETQQKVGPGEFFNIVKISKKNIESRLEFEIGTANGVRIVGDGFSSVRQYESNIEMARSLGLTIPDFAEIEDYETRILHQQREVYKYESLGLCQLMEFFESVYTQAYGPQAYERFMQAEEAHERIEQARKNCLEHEKCIRLELDRAQDSYQKALKASTNNNVTCMLPQVKEAYEVFLAVRERYDEDMRPKKEAFEQADKAYREFPSFNLDEQKRAHAMAAYDRLNQAKKEYYEYISSRKGELRQAETTYKKLMQAQIDEAYEVRKDAQAVYDKSMKPLEEELARVREAYNELMRIQAAQIEEERSRVRG